MCASSHSGKIDVKTMKFNPVLAVCTVLLSAVTAWLFYMGSESWVYAVGEGVLALAFLSVGLGGVSLKEYPRSSVFCVILSWLALVLGVVWGARPHWLDCPVSGM